MTVASEVVEAATVIVKKMVVDAGVTLKQIVSVIQQ
jgi:hypothetical protein